MKIMEIATERLVAVFLFAVLVLNPPFLLIFDIPAQVAGIPVLYLYLFSIWAVLIVILALVVERSKLEPDDEQRPLARPRANGAGSPGEGR